MPTDLPTPPSPGPLTRGERWFYALFVLAVFGLLAAEMIRDYRPVKLSMLFISLYWFPLLVIHEAGHALAARLLGWRVLRVVIGMGRPLARFTVGETRVELRVIPAEGFTLPVPRDLRRPRLKSTLVYLAGPLAELLTLGLLALLVGPGALLRRTESIGTIAAQSYAVAVLLGVTINLIPHTAETSHGRAANDGLGALRSLTAPRRYFERLLDED
jgi:membrane-associated protease RseP (regulator of RpoE activity)